MSDLFILSEDNSIVYGSIPYEEMLFNYHEYPIKKLGEYTISYLRIADVVLGIRYEGENCFESSKTLMLFKRYIESKNVELTANSIKSNYFRLFCGFDIADLRGLDYVSKTKKLDSKRKVYLDCIEAHDMLFASDGSIQSGCIYGSVRISGRTGKITIKMKVSEPAKLKTAYPLEFTGNEAVISVDKICGTVTLATYQILSEKSIISCKIDGDGCLISSENSLVFDMLDVYLPVSEATAISDLKVRVGKAVYDPDKSRIHWSIRNQEIKEERMGIPKSLMSKCHGAIQIKFRITGNESPAAEIMRFSEPEKNIQCWLRNIVQSGNYEVQVPESKLI